MKKLILIAGSVLALISVASIFLIFARRDNKPANIIEAERREALLEKYKDRTENLLKIDTSEKNTEPEHAIAGKPITLENYTDKTAKMPKLTDTLKKMPKRERKIFEANLRTAGLNPQEIIDSNSIKIEDSNNGKKITVYSSITSKEKLTDKQMDDVAKELGLDQNVKNTIVKPVDIVEVMKWRSSFADETSELDRQKLKELLKKQLSKDMKKNPVNDSLANSTPVGSERSVANRQVSKTSSITQQPARYNYYRAQRKPAVGRQLNFAPGTTISSINKNQKTTVMTVSPNYAPTSALKSEAQGIPLEKIKEIEVNDLMVQKP